MYAYYIIHPVNVFHDITCIVSTYCNTYIFYFYIDAMSSNFPTYGPDHLLALFNFALIGKKLHPKKDSHTEGATKCKTLGLLIHIT